MSAPTPRHVPAAVRFVTHAAAALALSLFLATPTVATAATLTIVWDPIPERADGYLVYVDTASGAPSQSFDVRDGATTFTYRDATPGETYYFSVAAYADGTVGPRANRISATVPAPPPAPVPVAPATLIQTPPTFSWMPAAGATSYLLSVSDTTQEGRVLARYSPEQAGCAQTIAACRIPTPVPIAPGPASWSVRASNAAGDGPWSAALAFTVAAPPPAAVPDVTAIPASRLALHFVDSEELAAENGAAINALDGNPSTFWHTRWQGGATPPPHEIQIALDAVYPIAGIRYLPRQDGKPYGRIARYELYVSDDGRSWGAAVATGTLADIGTEQQVLFPARTGRYVRLRALGEVAGRAFASAAEVTVLTSHAVAPRAVPVPRTAWTVHFVDSQETTGEAGYAAHAIDGDPHTHWHTQWAGTGAAIPHEIQIRLGGVYPVSGFTYLPRQDGGTNGRVGRYEVYVSLDGVTWGAPVAAGLLANVSSEQQVLFAPKSGQYVRLRALSEIAGRTFTSAAEIGVLAAELPPVPYTVPGSALRLRRVDSQETVGENGAGANAIDGNRNTYWHTQWKGTVSPLAHEIDVALDTVYAVRGFRYLPRQDASLNGRVGRYELYVSEDGASWGAPVVTGTFRNDSSEKEVLFPARAARYVRFRALTEVQGKSFTSVAELQVLAQH